MNDEKSSGGSNEHSKEEKTAIAGGVALLIVIILFFSWAMLFFKRVERGTLPTDLSTVAQEQFDLSSVRAAQEQLKESFNAVSDEFKTIRKDAESAGVSFEQMIETTDEPESLFGVPAE